MKAPFLRIVAGTGIAAPPPGAELAPPPRKKARVPYKDHEPIEYQDGLPIIDPAGEADKIFRSLAAGCARWQASSQRVHNLELATFAVWQLAKMLKEFRGNYYKHWHGELAGVS